MVKHILGSGKTYIESYSERNRINYIRCLYDNEIKRCRARLNEMRGSVSLKDYEKELIRESRQYPERKKGIYELLLMANMPLIFSFAEKAVGQYQALRINIEDIVSAGCCGFFRALDKFDLEKGKKVRLGNFALCYVRDCIKETVMNLSPGVAIPYYVFQQKRVFGQIDEATADSRTMKQKRYYEDLYRRCLSFSEKDEKEDDDMDNRLDYMDMDAAAGIMSSVEKSEARETITRALRSALTEKEFDAVKMRFGLCGGDILPVHEVTRELNLPAKELREILSGALVKLYKDEKVRELAKNSGFLF